MEIKTNGFFNKRAGGIGLGLLLIISYLSLKIIKLGFAWSIVWFGTWFSCIILAALAADLFENTESWIYYSLREIELQRGLSHEERVALIKSQIEIAANQYITIFLLTNGIDKLLERLKEDFKKVWKGVISVKELIVIICYIFYDFIIRGGTLDILNPYDMCIIIVIAGILKMVDATKGAASIIALMYSRIKESKDPERTLKDLSEYIKQLAIKFNIEYDIIQEAEVNCSLMSNEILMKNAQKIQEEIENRTLKAQEVVKKNGNNKELKPILNPDRFKIQE